MNQPKEHKEGCLVGLYKDGWHNCICPEPPKEPQGWSGACKDNSHKTCAFKECFCPCHKRKEPISKDAMVKEEWVKK